MLNVKRMVAIEEWNLADEDQIDIGVSANLPYTTHEFKNTLVTNKGHVKQNNLPSRWGKYTSSDTKWRRSRELSFSQLKINVNKNLCQIVSLRPISKRFGSKNIDLNFIRRSILLNSTKEMNEISYMQEASTSGRNKREMQNNFKVLRNRASSEILRDLI
jgi:hypothetical protein